MPLLFTMTYSPHQLAYFAHRLTLRGAADSMDRMAGALLDAQVDLNPHQVGRRITCREQRRIRSARSSPTRTGWARPITDNAKRQSLLKALAAAFARLQVLGAASKAIIFTELCCAQEFKGVVDGTRTSGMSKAVLLKCEWGHDGYRLKVANLPASTTSAPKEAVGSTAMRAGNTDTRWACLLDAADT